MAPTRRGGRPGNNWTRARRRKLVRLYSFTTLTIEDIRRVLQEDGFNPCTRDYKKQLKDLFPKDYSTGWRRYRPSNDSDARSRFGQLKSCKDGRISKHRSLRTRSLLRKTPRFGKCPSPADENDLAPFPSPWYNPLNKYSQSSTTSTSHIHPEALQIAESVPNPSAYDQSPTPSRDDDTPRTAHFNEETLQDRERAQFSSLANVKSGSVLETNPSQSPMSCFDSELSLNGSPGIFVQNHGSNLPSIEHPISSVPRDSVMLMKEEALPSSHELSIQNLQRRLVGKAGSDSINHINSVLCYSSSNSWRSSLVSLASSWKSGASSLINRQSSDSDVRMSTGSHLTPSEQKSWDELVDETQLAHPSHQEISLNARPCCGVIDHIDQEFSCIMCGFSTTHYNGRHCVKIFSQYMYTYAQVFTCFVGNTDHFGNTALHFAAASTCITTKALKTMITGGLNANARNASGESFMHVLNVAALGNITEFLDLLHFLEKNDYAFSYRDNHGRTVLHRFFEGAKLWKINKQQLEGTFRILLVDLAAVDNLGYDFGLSEFISSWVSSWGSAGVTWTKYILESRSASTLSKYRDISLQNVSYRAMWLSLNGKVEDLTREMGKFYPEWSMPWSSMREYFVNWVDVNGDTPLTALAKYWPESGDEEILDNIMDSLKRNGCNVHARDRQGYTALAIATGRGLQPSVSRLVTYGASVNTRSYHGTSTLHLATESLRRARKGGPERLYAMILSCIALIQHRGAKVEPSVYDEFRIVKPLNSKSPGSVYPRPNGSEVK